LTTATPTLATYFGWLMAKTNGLKHDAVLAKKAGSCDIKGVIKVLSPKQESITIKAYGLL